jgi:hypothetical protein
LGHDLADHAADAAAVLDLVTDEADALLGDVTRGVSADRIHHLRQHHLLEHARGLLLGVGGSLLGSLLAELLDRRSQDVLGCVGERADRLGT